MESVRFFRKTSDEAPLRRGGGKNSAPQALLRRRLLWPALALGGVLLLAGCASVPYQEPNKSTAYWEFTQRGLKYMVKYQEMAAEKEFQEAVHLCPKSSEAHANLGNAFNGQGKYADGEKEFREAIRLNPYNADAHSGLGKALQRQNKRKEAENEFKVAIRLDSKNAVAHNRFGIALIMRGDTAGAEREYRDAVRLKPIYWEALNNLAWLLEIQKKPEAAAYRKRADEARKKYGPPPIIQPPIIIR
jgi:Tfp pilus assembly protein PilF